MYFEHNKKYSFIKIIAKNGQGYVSTLRFIPGVHQPVKMEIVELTSTDAKLVPRVGELNRTLPGFVFHDANGNEWFHVSIDREHVEDTIHAAAIRNHVEVVHPDSDLLGMIHLVELEAYMKHISRCAYPGIGDTTASNHIRELHDQLLELSGAAVA